MDVTKKGNGERRIGNKGMRKGNGRPYLILRWKERYIFIAVFLIHNTFAIKRFKVTSENYRKKHSSCDEEFIT